MLVYVLQLRSVRRVFFAAPAFLTPLRRAVFCGSHLPARGSRSLPTVSTVGVLPSFREFHLLLAPVLGIFQPWRFQTMWTRKSASIFPVLVYRMVPLFFVFHLVL